MNWTCEQTEARLSDFLDDVLPPAEQTALAGHVASCERCAPLVASVSHVVANLHSMAELEMPPRLVYSILDKTLGPRDTLTGWRAGLAWLRGLGSARFVYSAVSVAATFLIIATASGFSWRKPKLADLAPMSVYRNTDRQAHLLYARSSKFVSDLRVVYEIQSRLRQDEQIPSTREESTPQHSPSNEPGRSDGTKSGSPRQQNRANGIEKGLEVLASSFPTLTGSFAERRNP